MRMLRFRVVGFRSVEDSGWVDVDDVTALIGENESGKTNLLVPLWKLNPASEDGKIDLLDDFPRNRYHEARATKEEDLPVFITVDFALSATIAQGIADLTGAPQEDVAVARVSRKFNGTYTVAFPNAKGQDVIAGTTVADTLAKRRDDIVNVETDKPAYRRARDKMIAAIDETVSRFKDVFSLTHDQLNTARDLILNAKSTQISKASDLAKHADALVAEIDVFIVRSTKQHPNGNADAGKKVAEELPRFVYYSMYGNLDSEIYLPHVIDNMKRIANGEKLGTRESAKARTLKVLFDFVRLKPEEIQALGRPPSHPQGPPYQPTAEQIAETAEKTKEREVLLTSASTDLTAKFREWWKQGQHKFRFQADGDHFRIWVSDTKRPEEIELEGRSSGLQWFFSFFLVFLVERSDEHKDAILLLDEPGMSLHPLAQRDLSRFFEGLAVENQLLYTSHSPFLLDYDRLDLVKVVYVNDTGATEISANLRAAEKEPSRTKSIYAVHAALGLSVSETLFIGGAPTIVEGTVDQIYMSLAKTRLIREGRIAPSREIVFVSAGGARGVSTVASIVSFADDSLPPVLLDSDGPGKAARTSLEQGLYKNSKDRLFSIEEFTSMADSEVEDLMPGSVLARVASRFYRTQSEDFDHVYETSKPIVPQIEAFASKYGLSLEPGWKVDLAKAFAAHVRAKPDVIDQDTLDRWQRLFEPIVEKIEASAPLA
jgi:energy-coupling factor transporter ATP-binding protein EcfA2